MTETYSYVFFSCKGEKLGFVGWLNFPQHSFKHSWLGTGHRPRYIDDGEKATISWQDTVCCAMQEAKWKARRVSPVEGRRKKLT